MVSNNKGTSKGHQFVRPRQRYKVWRHGDDPHLHVVIEAYSTPRAAEKFAKRDINSVKDYEDSAVRVYVIAPDGGKYTFDVERVMYMVAIEIEGPDDE